MKSTHRKKKGNINKKRTKRKYTKKTYGGAPSQDSEYDSQEFWDAFGDRTVASRAKILDFRRGRSQSPSPSSGRSRSRDRDNRLVNLIKNYEEDPLYRSNFEEALIQNFSDNLVKDNMTYLMLAVKYNNLFAFNRLIEYGANIDTQNTIGRTAFMFICFYGKVKMLNKILLDPTIDIFCPDLFGMTPMMHMCYKGKNKMIDILFEHVKRNIGLVTLVTQVDKFGNSAIHYACSRSDEAILSTIKVLIEISSSWNEPNAHGVTPLDFARYKKNNAVIGYLESLTPKASSLLEGHPQYKKIVATEIKRLQVITEENPSEFDVNNVAISPEPEPEPESQASVIAQSVKPPPA